MSLIEIKKARDYKTVKIFGLEFKIPRKDYKATFRPFKRLKPGIELKKDGFSIMGDFNSISGESVALRYFIYALKQINIPFECLDIRGDCLPKYKNKITFSSNPYFKPKEYNNITGMFWEFEDGMTEERPYAFDGISSVLCFSDFNAYYFKKIAPEKVKIFQLPFIPSINAENLSDACAIREKYNLPEKSFICYFNFSYHSSYYRKNPEAVIEAFSKAFPDDSFNAVLVLKTIGSSDPAKQDRISALHKRIDQKNIKDKTIIINDNLTDNENFSLINACDVYISLHRGEGIGLGMLEAMSLGKAVVATNYGGNTDFIKKGVSFPVGYRLIKPETRDISSYAFVTKCAEANTDEAAAYLRKLYEDRNLCIQTGNNAKDFVKTYCSIEQYKKVLKEILEN